MSTTYYQLFNAKRRLTTVVLIVITLVAFVLPFFNVVYQGKTVAKISGLEMLFGKRGFTIIKEMGLDMGFTRTQLADWAVSFGYVVLPLIAVIIPVAAMILGINFMRSNTRGSAVLCTIMMLLSLVFYHQTMIKNDGKVDISLRVAKRYVTESADKGKQFVANNQPILDTAQTPEQKKTELNKILDEMSVAADQKTQLIDIVSKLDQQQDMSEDQIKKAQTDLKTLLGSLQGTDDQKTRLNSEIAVVPMTNEQQAELKTEIAKQKVQADQMGKYLTFLSGKIPGWDLLSIETNNQDKAKQAEALQTETTNNVLLHLEAAKIGGLKTGDILQILMILAIIASGFSAVGKYKMAG